MVNNALNKKTPAVTISRQHGLRQKTGVGPSQPMEAMRGKRLVQTLQQPLKKRQPQSKDK